MDSVAAKAAETTQKEFNLLKLDEKAMMRIFDLFDQDHSGFLDTEEIEAIVREMGIPDYERDGYRGIIVRNKKLLNRDKAKIAGKDIEYAEFKVLLQSLVT